MYLNYYNYNIVTKSLLNLYILFFIYLDMKIICKKCKEEFEAITKHQKYCDSCLKIRNNEMKDNNNSINKKNYNKNNKERYRTLRDDERYIKRMKEYLKIYYQNNKDKFKKYINNYYFKHKEKVFSRINTNVLLNYEYHLIKKCNKCGSTLNLEIHHEIYPILLDEIVTAINDGKIYYLCRKCHRKLSRTIL